MKKKVNVLVRLHKAMQEKSKTASYSQPMQIFTLVRMVSNVQQNILISCNTLFELHMKSKKQAKYQQNLLLKKRKAITETLHLVTNVFEDDNFSIQVLENKDYVSVSKRVHKQKLQIASLCNLQEFYTAFKEKHPHLNIGYSKFCAQRPKWFVLAESKMTHSLCV